MTNLHCPASYQHMIQMSGSGGKASELATAASGIQYTVKCQSKVIVAFSFNALHIQKTLQCKSISRIRCVSSTCKLVLCQVCQHRGDEKKVSRR